MMDGDRGDDISIVRAEIRPAEALEGPTGASRCGLRLFAVAAFGVLMAYVPSLRAVAALSANWPRGAATQTTRRLLGRRRGDRAYRSFCPEAFPAWKAAAGWARPGRAGPTF